MHCEEVHGGTCPENDLRLPSQYQLNAMELIRAENATLNQVDLTSLSATLEKLQFGQLIEAKAASRESSCLFAETISIWRLPPPSRPECEPAVPANGPESVEDVSAGDPDIVEIFEHIESASGPEIIEIGDPPRRVTSDKPRTTIHHASLIIRKDAPPASGLRPLDPTKYARMIVTLDRNFGFTKRGPSGVTTLVYEDFASMSYTRWVNDAAIHESLHLLCSRSEQTSGPRFCHFDTLFSLGLNKKWTFPKLKSVTNKTRWNEDQTIFIPHNLNQSCKKCQPHQPVGDKFSGW